ncbi:MAG: hypothetical protein SFH39_18615, partial [Candidatus Magnetobacterium sp. LHC-1]
GSGIDGEIDILIKGDEMMDMTCECSIEGWMVVAGEERLFPLLEHIDSIFERGKGLEIDPTIADFFGISIEEIKKLAEEIETEKKTNKYILFSTQIIMELLSGYHVINCESLDNVRVWLSTETGRCRPSLGGVTLEEWVSEYVKKLKETNK